MSALIPLLVTLPLLGAAVALFFGRARRVQVGVSLVTLTLVLVIAAVLLYTVDSTGQALAVSVGGWPIPFGIVLYVDRLAALLVVVSSVVLLAVLLFSVGQGAADGDDDTPVTIFHPSYLILAAGIFNAFIAGDLFNLYVGFEILLVASYVLITLGSTESRIRTGVVYIVVSLVSSILFLAAIAAIYGALGTVNIAQLSERMGELPQSTQLVLHLMLLLAFSIKAAVFPLSFWLPDSYPTAPAPVTAVFAGQLTKVGVYAMIRTETQIFRDNDVITLLLIVALATMIVGVLGALAQAELKRILSFTLVSHVGYLVFGLAIATPVALGATIYYMVHHIIVQTTLFLAVGLVDGRFDRRACRRLVVERGERESVLRRLDEHTGQDRLRVALRQELDDERHGLAEHVAIHVELHWRSLLGLRQRTSHFMLVPSSVRIVERSPADGAGRRSPRRGDRTGFIKGDLCHGVNSCGNCGQLGGSLSRAGNDTRVSCGRTADAAGKAASERTLAKRRHPQHPSIGSQQSRLDM